MPLNIHHEDVIKQFADKTGISKNQAKKLFGKEVTGYSRRSITNEGALKKTVEGAIKRAEELGIELDQGGKSGHGFRVSVERRLKKAGAEAPASGSAAGYAGGLWSNIKSAFGASPMNGVAPNTKKQFDSVEFFKKVRSGNRFGALQNKKAAAPQRIDLATSGFERIESAASRSENEPRAPDIG